MCIRDRVKKDQTVMNITIGEDEGDPVFCITDLLPHLAAKQNERPLKDGIKGEELNIVIGSLPYDCLLYTSGREGL